MDEVLSAWILIEQFIKSLKVFPDSPVAKVAATPSLNAFLGEVGLKVPEIVSVGGPTRQKCHLPLGVVRTCGLATAPRRNMSCIMT
jgi:hypothetical protein